MSKRINASALIKKMPRETLESILLERIGEDAALERRILAEYGSSTTVEHYRSLVDGMLEGCMAGVTAAIRKTTHIRQLSKSKGSSTRPRRNPSRIGRERYLR
ncbi:MAG: hypothetical protein ABSF43_06540 [Rectinemataceae bacterium]